ALRKRCARSGGKGLNTGRSGSEVRCWVMSSTTRWPTWRMASGDQSHCGRISGVNARVVRSGMPCLLSWLVGCTYSGRPALDVHPQVVHGRLVTGIDKAMPAVTVVIDAIAGIECIGSAVNGQAERAPLYSDPLQRTRGMGRKHSGIDPGIDRGAHKFELHSG